MSSHLSPCLLNADTLFPQRTTLLQIQNKWNPLQQPMNAEGQVKAGCWCPGPQGQVPTRQLLARSRRHRSLQRSLLNRHILPSKHHIDEKLHLYEGKHSLTQLTTFRFEVLFVTTKHYSPHQGVVFLPGVALCFNRVWMPETATVQ